MEPRYYRMDNRALSVAEAFRFKPGPLGIVAFLMARAGLARSKNIAWMPPRLREIASPREELSSGALAQLDPILDDLRSIGFRVASYVTVRRGHAPGRIDDGGCWLLHDSGESVAFVVYYLTKNPLPERPPVEGSTIAIVRPLRDGRAVAATNEGRTYDPLPGTIKTVIPGATPARLAASIDAYRAKHPEDAPMSIRTVDELATIADDRSARQLDLWVRRGLYVEMTDAEVAAAIADGRLSDEPA